MDQLDILFRVAFVFFLLAFAGHIFSTWKRIKAIKEQHAVALRVERDKGYSTGYQDGWDQAHIVGKIGINIRYGKLKLKEPAPGTVVQHCNSRTDYEFITHPYDPETCEHCLDIRHVVTRSN